MKAPVGLLSDRTVLRSKMEGPRPDKFTLTQHEFYGNLSQQLNITYFYRFAQTLRCEIFEMMREYVGAKHNKA